MVETLIKNLKELGYEVSFFDTATQAVVYMNQKIDGKTIGFGGSVSLDQMGLYDSLGSHNTVYWHNGVTDKKVNEEMKRKAATADIYISSVNAIAETGEIVNIDGLCNRVSAIFYGHEKVYLVIGTNKIEKDYDKALYRARNIAAPLNAKRLGRNTPCAKNADRCYDCKSPDRICKGLSVLWGKPIAADFEIILIDENLGY